MLMLCYLLGALLELFSKLLTALIGIIGNHLGLLNLAFKILFSLYFLVEGNNDGFEIIHFNISLIKSCNRLRIKLHRLIINRIVMIIS